MSSWTMQLVIVHFYLLKLVLLLMQISANKQQIEVLRKDIETETVSFFSVSYSSTWFFNWPGINP